MYHRLLAHGARGRYVPDLVIYHHVPAARLTQTLLPPLVLLARRVARRHGSRPARAGRVPRWDSALPDWTRRARACAPGGRTRLDWAARRTGRGDSRASWRAGTWPVSSGASMSTVCTRSRAAQPPTSARTGASTGSTSHEPRARRLDRAADLQPSRRVCRRRSPAPCTRRRRPDTYELIVVDNNSTDGHSAVIVDD